ncbi:mitochondrial ornithine transporter 1-like [Schistocerca piceifrons]|uniref:mitochondrial ornithine transporter 1-like n=1 Tax=Schistocerca piceifrons TaxID=274613 RepID=UPI001F5F7E50|nr:mitochondrial ornithine transporter 1-like [Schistocerca piceifrons]
MESLPADRIIRAKSSGNVMHAAVDFIAGSLGGISMVYAGQPLDTVKVKMQTFPNLYRGMMDCLRQTWMKEGLRRGLYAGAVPAVIANVAEKSVLFVAYGSCQKLIMKLTGIQRVEELRTFSNAAAGSLSAIFSSLTLCPTELVKCKLQALRETSSQSKTATQNCGPIKMTKYIIKNEGAMGLFRGLTSTMAREMFGNFFFFGGYEGARQLLTPPGKSKDEIGAVRTMVAGATGGFVFWLVVFPVDAVKSRIQVGGLKEPMISVALRVARQEGISALYNGLQPSLVRTIPACATLFLVYENSKKMLLKLLE